MMQDFKLIKAIERRFEEDADVLGKATALICIGLITVGSGYFEILTSNVTFSAQARALQVLFPATFFGLMLYMTLILLRGKVITFPWERQYPELIIINLIVCGLGNATVYLTLMQANDIDRHVVTFMVMVSTVGCGVFRNEIAVFLIIFNSALSFFYLHSLLPIVYLVLMVNGQLLINWLFKSMVKEYQEKVISNQHLAELIATQRMLKSRVEQDTRQHIARDLHDELGHLSTVISNNIQQYLNTEPAKHPLIEQVYPIVLSLNEQIRTISDSMRHAQLELTTSLETLASHTHSPRIEVTTEGFDGKCSPTVAEAVFRACQESITNTIKHSNATKMQIHLCVVEGALRVTIQDNGTGKSGILYGNGLTGISSRITEIGGGMEAKLTADGFLANLSIPLS